MPRAAFCWVAVSRPAEEIDSEQADLAYPTFSVFANSSVRSSSTNEDPSERKITVFVIHFLNRCMGCC